MAAKRGTCSNCGTPDRSLPAHDMCGACYDRLYPPETRIKKPRKILTKKRIEEICIFPRRQVLTVYECSDGREFSTELEAYKHQLGITADKLAKFKGAKS
jgi:hypothetical protein